MSTQDVPSLNIGGLHVPVPIIQGGMGVGISLAGLASAVANAGGIGVIATAGIGQFESCVNTKPREADLIALPKEIRKARSMTDGIIGVNIMVALSDFDSLVQSAVDAGVDLLLLGAGLPMRLPSSLGLDRLGDLHAKFAPIVSSGKATRVIFASWEKRYNHVPDAVVVEGPLAGGHLGFKPEQIDDPEYTLEKILPDVLSIISGYEEKFNKSIPVIAAGGIYTGGDIHRIMQMGAKGVQMGTRFVGSVECDASDEFKDAYLQCTKEDLMIINSPVGLPGRAIKGAFLERIASGQREKFTCPWKCLRSCDFKKAAYCIARALTNAKDGRLDEGFAFAGANAYRVNEILPLQQIMDALVEEYSAARQSTEAAV